MVDLCKWECDEGQQELFPFDVTRKCSLPVPPSFSDPAFFRPAASPGEGDARAETTPALIPLVSSSIPQLVNTHDDFRVGKIISAESMWRSLTQDSWIYVVRGNFLDFVSLPIQTVPPRPLTLSQADD
ncbi:hypothetical protein E2C01_071477 [Portunus trituberculatus]|uniref:Uncharacterized protein n=1 Tax=Portunus trituberculatus TaxID=210409 RepID=A0A5B7I836_PORTR|nr:hypothetical protein [Portunus trituberculatus]